MCDFIEDLPPQHNGRPSWQVPPPQRAMSRSHVRGHSRANADEPLLFEDGPPLLMATTAWHAMMTDLTSRPAEAGGVLVGPADHDAVTHYIPDLTGTGTGASFTFDDVRMNALLRQYGPLGLDAKGVAHSHPAGCLSLSGGDLTYVGNCFAKTSRLELDRFYMPIVVSRRLYPYIVYRGERPIAVYAQLILF